MTAYASAKQAYAEASVMTASPEQLIVMLYDGAIRFLRQAHAALAAGERERVPSLMSDRWLRDVTLFGSAREVREGVAAWHAARVNSVILVPSSTRGGQMQAFQELLAAFA